MSRPPAPAPVSKPAEPVPADDSIETVSVAEPSEPPSEVPSPRAAQVAGSPAADSGGYDEEQWQGTLASGDSMAGAEYDEESGLEPSGGPALPPMNNGPVPEMDELLKQVPARTQELVDVLFRGRFVSVQVVNRNELY